MPTLYTQAGRLIALTSPLGEDKLLLTGFTGHEAISRLFHFHLTTLSEDTAIDFTTIVGQSVTINVVQFDDSKRYFNGIVSHFACTGKDGDMTRYELQVVPKLWLLTRYADCRIFHNKDVTEIVKSVLDDRGIKYQASLTGTLQQAGVLRSIPGDRLQFRFPADGAIRHFLFLPARRRRSHHDAGRLQQRASALPGPGQRWIQPGERGAGRREMW